MRMMDESVEHRVAKGGVAHLLMPVSFQMIVPADVSDRPPDRLAQRNSAYPLGSRDGRAAMP